jgi:hypothetical protein
MHAACRRGPQLAHWVVRCDDIDGCCDRLRERGIERGPVLAAQRDTPQGALHWRISVRDDGARLFDGASPTLIEWQQRHPTDTMAPSGVVLERLELGGLPSAVHDLLDIDGVSFAAGGAPLVAQFTTPRGVVTLQSPLPGDADVQP